MFGYPNARAIACDAVGIVILNLVLVGRVMNRFVIGHLIEAGVSTDGTSTRFQEGRHRLFLVMG